MRHLLLSLCLLIAAGVPAAMARAEADADAAAAEAIVRIAWVWVELDAAGGVTAITQDEGQNPIVAGVLEAHARRLQFDPATVDGTPVASAVPLELTVRFVPVEGGFRPDLLDARVFAARGVALTPPRYPRDAAVAGIGGFVRVAMTVAADGRPDPATITVEDSGFFGGGSGRAGRLGEALVAATTATAAHWTWRNARIGDEPVAVRLATPAVFRPAQGRGTAELPPALAERAAISTPAGIIDARRRLPVLRDTFPDAPAAAGREAIEVQLTRVRRGS